MILKIFLPINFAKKLTFLTQNKDELLKNLIITLVFNNNANSFAENWEKSPKIVIITSTPGHTAASREGKAMSALKTDVCRCT
jgi:hypothetical protein